MSRYTEYAARVVADGGVITDAAACQAAIEAIEAGCDFAGLAVGISPRWGVKLSGSNITKFYNIADNDKDGTVTGTIARDTSGDYAFAEFTTATVAFTAVPTNVQGYQGALWKDDSPGILTLNAGAYLSWTDGVVTHYAAAGAAHVRGSETIQGPSDAGPTETDTPGVLAATGDTSGVWMNTELGGGVVFIDGAPRVYKAGASRQNLDATFDLTLQRVSGTVSLVECLLFNDITYDEFAAVALTQAARY